VPLYGDEVVIFRSPHRAQCAERALVLTAMDIPHRVRRDGPAWVLLVPEPLTVRALDQLDAYRRENQSWPSKPSRLFHHPAGFDGVAAYLVILGLVAALDWGRLFDVDWRAAGRMDTGLVRAGQWWRTVTSLTLHTDAPHLIGNAFFGVLFGFLAGRLLGSGLAWCSILVAGAAGNALNAMVQAPEHRAVGASTAVFAALGLLGAYVWRGRRDMQSRWALRWAPIVGVVVLLAFTGFGGERTDIVAHVTGFLAGIGLGWFYGMRKTRMVLGSRGQTWLAVGAVAALVVCWTVAIVAAR
jgi:membrane associated rhomboid family serine protease